MSATALDVYQLFLATKQHFSDSSYDFFKYQGKVRVNADKFSARRDKFFFEKIKRQLNGNLEEIKDFFVANIHDDPKVWITQLIEKEAMVKYEKWKAYQESLTYNITQDLELISEKLVDGIDFNSALTSKDGEYPLLFELYENKQISTETLIAFDKLLSVFRQWNENINDPLVWPLEYEYLKRYAPFIEFNLPNIRKAMKKTFM